MNESVPLQVHDVRHFVGSEDFALSRDFYQALGWTLMYDDGGIAVLELGGHRFYLQAYFQKDWCENSMIHVQVQDAAAWFERASSVVADSRFARARVQPPVRQDYGALTTFVHDPAGVLIHFAQLDP